MDFEEFREVFKKRQGVVDFNVKSLGVSGRFSERCQDVLKDFRGFLEVSVEHKGRLPGSQWGFL